jgi:serine kinase of HPr protein (carbohydrate metabolism regulator)
MTVGELQQQLNLEWISGRSGIERPVAGAYIGDMLSWVMAKAGQETAWITIQTNLNILAVAIMADISCIIIAENAEIPIETISKSDDEEIPILRSPMSAYDLAVSLHGVIRQ